MMGIMPPGLTGSVDLDSGPLDLTGYFWVQITGLERALLYTAVPARILKSGFAAPKPF